MSKLTRRDLCAAFTAIAAVGALPTTSNAQPSSHDCPVAKSEQPTLTQSHAFSFESLEVNTSENGSASRAVTQGVLATGEFVEVHESMLPAGESPHPPHKHRHSEFIMVREGTLEFNNNGKVERVGPGGVLFAASNVMHGIKNVGKVPANYFVVSVSRPSEPAAV